MIDLRFTRLRQGYAEAGKVQCTIFKVVMNWEHVVAFVVISVSMLLSMYMSYMQGRLHGFQECRAIVEKHFAERKEGK